jgi:hypothetical protein
MLDIPTLCSEGMRVMLFLVGNGARCPEVFELQSARGSTSQKGSSFTQDEAENLINNIRLRLVVR